MTRVEKLWDAITGHRAASVAAVVSALAAVAGLVVGVRVLSPQSAGGVAAASPPSVSFSAGAPSGAGAVNPERSGVVSPMPVAPLPVPTGGSTAPRPQPSTTGINWGTWSGVATALCGKYDLEKTYERMTYAMTVADVNGAWQVARVLSHSWVTFRTGMRDYSTLHGVPTNDPRVDIILDSDSSLTDNLHQLADAATVDAFADAWSAVGPTVNARVTTLMGPDVGMGCTPPSARP